MGEGGELKMNKIELGRDKIRCLQHAPFECKHEVFSDKEVDDETEFCSDHY